LISGQADAKTAKRAHDDAKVQLAAAQTTAGRAPARRRDGRGRPAGKKYEAAVASAFASPELAAQLAQDGVNMLDICEWIVDKEPGFHDEWENGSAFRNGVSEVLSRRPEYVFGRARGNAAALWRRVPVDGQASDSSSGDEIDLDPSRPSSFDPRMFAAAGGPSPVAQAPPAVQAPQAMDVEAPEPPVVQAQQAMDVAEPAPLPVAPPPVAPVAQAPSPAPVAQAPSPAVVVPTPPRAPPDVAWGFDTPVWSVEAKFTSNPKQRILIGHYLEDEPNLTLLDRMGEVHGLVVVAETADEKFALVGATPRIAAGIRSGRFYAATQGEDCFFVTVESDARRPYERRSRPHTRFRSRRRRRVPAQQAAGLRR